MNYPKVVYVVRPLRKKFVLAGIMLNEDQSHISVFDAIRCGGFDFKEQYLDSNNQFCSDCISVKDALAGNYCSTNGLICEFPE